MTNDPLFTGPAIRVEQPIGEFWVASIPANVLLEATVPDPLRLVLDPKFAGSDEWKRGIHLLGNQRMLHEKRTKEIGRYIDSLESTFPNSIILAANSIPEGLEESTESLWFIEEAATGHQLVIPHRPERASIVDGQHRLYGFLHTEIGTRPDFELVCAIFFDIPHSMQAMIFATINTNQKPVRRGMALNLYGYNTEDEDRSLWSPEKLAVFIARRLNFDQEHSRLFHRIKIEAEGAPTPRKLRGARRAISLAAVVDGVLYLISSKPQRDRDQLRTERFLRRMRRTSLPGDSSAPLRDWYREGADSELYGLIVAFVGLLDEEVWKSATSSSMLTRAVGIRALFGFLKESLLRLGTQERRPEQSLDTLLGGVKGVLGTTSGSLDFGHPYFEPTGRGQKRILNVLMVRAGWETISSISRSDEEAETLAEILETGPQ